MKKVTATLAGAALVAGVTIAAAAPANAAFGPTVGPCQRSLTGLRFVDNGEHLVLVEQWRDVCQTSVPGFHVVFHGVKRIRLI